MVPARPQPLGGLRDGRRRAPEADRPHRLRDDAGPPPHPPRQPGRRRVLWQQGRAHDPRPRRPGPGPAPRPGPARPAAPDAARRSRTSRRCSRPRHQAIKRRSLVVIVSDFISAPGWERPLDLLHRRHEVLAVRLIDPRESELPDVGPIIMEDAETGEQLYVDTGDKGFRRRFAEAAAHPRGGRQRRVPAGRRRGRLALDRRGPRAGDRPDGDAPSPAAGLTVSFIWPTMLVAVALVPFGRPAVPASSTRRRRRALHRRRAAASAQGDGPPAARRPARIPARPVRRRARPIMTVALARPQAAVSLPSQRGHRHPRLRRVRQHGRRRPQADPDGRRQGRHPGVRGAPAGRASSIGVVAFSDAGLSVQAPTSDQAAVLAAIKRLTPERGTSLGQGIRAALSTIAIAENGPAIDYYTQRSPDPSAPTATPPRPCRPSRPARTPRRSSSCSRDGENTAPPTPDDAAQAAADAGVRIYTVGHRQRRRHDARRRTGSRSTPSSTRPRSSASPTSPAAPTSPPRTRTAWRKVYDEVDSKLVVKPQQIEVTSLFAGASVLLLTLGGLTSLAWLGRLP